MDTTLNAPFPTTSPALDVPPAVKPHLLERIVDGAHHTIDRLAEQAAPHAQQLEETVSGANQLLHERADQAREVGDAWMISLRDAVREHPLAAVATALAAGLLIARLSQSHR